MKLLTTGHLKFWAQMKASETDLPRLVKDLITAVITPESLRIPSEDAVWVPGADGIIKNSQSDRHVPCGDSLWEIGKTENFKTKALSDYRKRSKKGTRAKPSFIDHSSTTFVFVTPHIWLDKEKWVAAREATHLWQSVVVIDGVDLIDWLERAPSVHLRLAGDIGLVPKEGLYEPESVWIDWTRQSNPAISEGLVTIGRTEEQKRLLTKLREAPSTVAVRGDSPREALGFVLATLRSIENEEEKRGLLSRVIVAEDERVALNLRAFKNLIVLLRSATGTVSSVLEANGNHLLISEGNDAETRSNVITLGRITASNEFTDALVRMGLSTDDAPKKARECAMSVTVFQRLNAHASFQSPKWADYSHASNLFPALLGGRWNDRNQHDRSTMVELAELEKYDQLEKQLRPYLAYAEPPIRQIGEMWTLTAPVDAFHLIAKHLSKANLKSFMDEFRKVFSAIDADIEGEAKSWYAADGARERSSGWLRSGLAESLLLIAERGADAGLICVSPKEFANEVVRSLPGLRDDWRVVASIRDEYARLAEAAPDPLLDSLEHLLEAHPDDAKKLFIDSDGLFGPPPLHTGLLWGLETLAWDPDYLPRVSLLLAQLSDLDPGGRLANRPINSLGEIYLWWNLGTRATAEMRLDVIDAIIDSYPNVGWQLLERLLPGNRNSVSSGTAKPRWRVIPEFIQSKEDETFIYVAGIIDRALIQAGLQPSRWSTILESIKSFDPVRAASTFSRLEQVIELIKADEIRAELWSVLRDFINHHRTFRDTRWALDEDKLLFISDLADRLAPQNVIERQKWLFDDWLPELPTGEGHEEREAIIKERRTEAISTILKARGISGLLDLVISVRYPGFIADPLIVQQNSITPLVEIVLKAIEYGERGVDFISHVSEAARKRFGDIWTKEAMALLPRMPPTASAALFFWWPEDLHIWEYIEATSPTVDAELWKHRRIYALDGTQDVVEFEIRKLLQYDRAAQAFDAIAMRPQNISSDNLLKVFDATMDQLIAASSEVEVRRLGLNSYDMNAFLDAMRSRSDIERDDIAKREYRALPILGYSNTSGLTIHKMLAENPELYVDLLCDVFSPSNRDKSLDKEPSDEARARATSAYRLINGMRTIPGETNDSIDATYLENWIRKVRTLAKARDRAAVADISMGEFLAHISPDPADGAWPHFALREAIDRVKASDFERGILTGCFNKRGVFSKAMFEGGLQERQLAADYRDWAVVVRAKHPRTAKLLEAMAKQWEAEGLLADKRAEQDRLG